MGLPTDVKLIVDLPFTIVTCDMERVLRGALQLGQPWKPRLFTYSKDMSPEASIAGADDIALLGQVSCQPVANIAVTVSSQTTALDPGAPMHTIILRPFNPNELWHSAARISTCGCHDVDPDLTADRVMRAMRDTIISSMEADLTYLLGRTEQLGISQR
jgi:hypothetical protein